MFKKVISTKGFWKSVFSLAAAFAILFTLIKWAIEGFEIAYFTERDPVMFILTLMVFLSLSESLEQSSNKMILDDERQTKKRIAPFRKY